MLEPQLQLIYTNYRADDHRERNGTLVQSSTGGGLTTRLGVRLHRDEPRELRAKIEEFKQHRKRTQPPQQSAGSVFKNPQGDYAARLIEQAGLKGRVHGKARISERHANFIVNSGGARAADVVALIVEARRQVKEQFKVDLELEVELRGAWEDTPT